jgi:hypothetical protein
LPEAFICAEAASDCISATVNAASTDAERRKFLREKLILSGDILLNVQKTSVKSRCMSDAQKKSAPGIPVRFSKYDL